MLDLHYFIAFLLTPKSSPMSTMLSPSDLTYASSEIRVWSMMEFDWTVGMRRSGRRRGLSYVVGKRLHLRI
ncbi:unnamed protein product [Prunus armeniaca]